MPGGLTTLLADPQISPTCSEHDLRRDRVFRNPGEEVLEQIQLSGPCHRLRAAVRVELAVEVVEVGLDGAHADEELGGDLAVGLAGGYERKDLQLALAQGFGEPRCRPATRCRRPAPAPPGAS